MKRNLLLVLCLSALSCTNPNAQTLPEKKDETVPVTRVSISQASLELKVGDEASLSARVMPANATNQNVSWTSDDESVATVDASNGRVKALAPGKAVVTVTTQEGSFTEYYDNGVRHTQGSFKNRMKHGKWSSWTPQGKLFYSAIFENGHKVKVVYAADPNKQAF